MSHIDKKRPGGYARPLILLAGEQGFTPGILPSAPRYLSGPCIKRMFTKTDWISFEHHTCCDGLAEQAR